MVGLNRNRGAVLTVGTNGFYNIRVQYSLEKVAEMDSFFLLIFMDFFLKTSIKVPPIIFSFPLDRLSLLSWSRKFLGINDLNIRDVPFEEFRYDHNLEVLEVHYRQKNKKPFQERLFLQVKLLQKNQRHH